MLYSCNCLSIFLNKKLNRSYTQTSVLCRYKKRIFMTFIRCKILSFLKVIKKGFPYFIPKVYKAFSATFSYNLNSVPSISVRRARSRVLSFSWLWSCVLVSLLPDSTLSRNSATSLGSILIIAFS